MNFDMDFAVRNFYVTLTGVPTTLLITAVAVLVGFPLAFFIALLRFNKKNIISEICALYISLFRGIPVIVLIFLFYNSLPEVLKWVVQFLHIDLDVYAIDPLYYAFFVFILTASASFSEMWKTGLSSVGRGQLEAAVISGLSPFQAYIHVIIPQALATVAPSFCSITLNLLKDTSPVFIMTVQDITARAKMAAGLEYKYIEGFVDAFLVYVIVCYTLEWILKKWEVRLTAFRNKPAGKSVSYIADRTPLTADKG